MTTLQTRLAAPAYRRQTKPNGKNLAFVLLDGHRYYLGAYDSPESRAKYHQLIAEWEIAGRVAPQPQETITVQEIVARYLAWAKTYYLKHNHLTAEPGNVELACRPLLKLFGPRPAAQFGPKSLKAVQQAMVNQGYVRKHINRNISRVKRVFKWAVAEELVPSGIYEGLRAVNGLRFGRCGARDNPPVQPAPEDLIEPIKRLVSRQVAAMIDLQLLTGARPGEIVILRPCDIDRSGPVWLYRPAEHKTEHHGHDRTIFLGPKAQQVLQPFLDGRPADRYCFSPAEGERERYQELAATTENGGRRVGKNRRANPKRVAGDHYTPDSYRRAIDRASELAFPLPEHLQRGRKANGRLETLSAWRARLTPEQKGEIRTWYRRHHWHPHQLRHNYATWVRKEYGLEAAQVLLGHSKADVTQVYAERDMERAAQVAAKIG